MATNRPRRWIWIALMVGAMLWYAWPQILYSLIPLYDLFQLAFPAWAESLRPWIESMRAGMAG